MQGGEPAAKPSALLLAAFRAESWLHWLRYGAPAGGAPPVATQAAHPPALPLIMDVHRLSRAQARAAVLAALHDAAAQLPPAEVAAHRAATVEGAPRLLSLSSRRTMQT